MRKPPRTIPALLLLAVFALVLWMLVRPRDPIIHGKRQSEWISTLTNPVPLRVWYSTLQTSNGDGQKEIDPVKQWRALGPEGIQMLCLALQDGTSWPAQTWLRFYNSCPARFQRFLPKPYDTSDLRARAAQVLGELAKENKDVAFPALLRALKKDPDLNVRISIIGQLDAFNLFKGNDPDRLAFLPELIRAATNADNDIIRDDAYIVLRIYPDRAATLIPVLSNALSDSSREARWNAAVTLHQIAPDVAKPQIVAAITNIIHGPDDPILLPAKIEFLGDMRKDALPAVPALLEASHSTNAAIAEAAQHALAKIAP